MTLRTTSSLTLALVLITTLGACSGSPSSPVTSSAVATDASVAGDIPDSTTYIRVSAPSNAYSVTVPQGWSQSSASTPVWSDKLNSIALDQGTATSHPTVASTNSDLVPSLKAAGRKFELTDVTAVTRAGGSAIRVRYLVDSARNTVTGKVVRDAVETYVYWNNGTEAVLTLTGPQAADNVDPWKTVSDSLRWTA